MSENILDKIIKKKIEKIDILKKSISIDSLENKISLNPILNSFQKTVHKYNIDVKLINAFLKSMRWDLNKKQYLDKSKFDEYDGPGTTGISGG